MLQPYREYSPTGCDTRGLNADRHGIGDWLVLPVILTRDSLALETSNFRSALRALGGESDDVQVHEFGHWACGWFQIILVRPDTPAHTSAQEISDALEDYPIVDESDWSELEYSEVYAYWERMCIRERVDVCRRADVSIFAARHDDQIPDRVYERLSTEV